MNSLAHLNQVEWFVYARNCGSPETCCARWFCMNPRNEKREFEPLTYMKGLQVIQERIDVWREYALVHLSAKGDYECHLELANLQGDS